MECPILSDLGVYIEWAKFDRADGKTNGNISKLEVLPTD
jgi:hypothetical protein